MTRAVVAFLLVLAVAVVAGEARQSPQVVSLAKATERSLQTHDKIAAALAERRLAERASWRAWTALAPSVEVSGGYTREKDEIRFPNNLAALGGLDPVILQKEASRGALTVMQPIVSPQFWALRNLGTAEKNRADEVLRAARQDVILAVSIAYYGVLRAKSLADVSRETVELAQLEAQNATIRSSAGDAVRSDVLRAETEVERARQRALEASGNLETSRRRLSRLLAMEDSFEVEEAPDPRIDLTSAEALVQSALAMNPEVLQAQRGLESIQAEERRLKAALYPTLGLRFEYRVVDSGTFAERNNFWEAVAGIKVPLLASGGSQWIAWWEQKARVEKGEAEVRDIRRDVDLGVREALISAKTLSAREEVAGKEERLAVETHRLLSESYREGVATSVELLAALNARGIASAEHAGVRYDRKVALVRLQRTVGLLGEPPIPPYGRVVVTDEQIITLELSKVNFDGSLINPSSYPTLDEVAQVLLEHPKMRVLVVNYADSRPGPPSGAESSQARSDAVVRFLLGKHVPASQLQGIGVAERASGLSNLSPNNDGSGRTEFLISPP